MLTLGAAGVSAGTAGHRPLADSSIAVDVLPGGGGGDGEGAGAGVLVAGVAGGRSSWRAPADAIVRSSESLVAGGGLAATEGAGAATLGEDFRAGAAGTDGGGAGFGIAGTLEIGGGVGTRVAVSGFGRGAFAGVGTIGRVVVGLGRSSIAALSIACDPRADCAGRAGGRSFGVGAIVFSTAGSAAGFASGATSRSSARSRSSSSGGGTRDHHCRTMISGRAM